MSRVLGVDLGSRRIGLAVSDPEARVATPVGVRDRPADPAALADLVLAEARRAGATRIVVGLPRSLAGHLGPAAAAVLDDVARLRAAAGPGLAGDVCDERFTTVIAARGAGRRRAGRRSRRPLDDAAATVMLQSYLDAHRADDGPGAAVGEGP